MDCSRPGFPVHHLLLEPTQTHVCCVSDAIQPSHPRSSLSPPDFKLSQHQGLFNCLFFASGGQSIGVSVSASALPMNIWDWFPLGWTGWISLQSKGLSRVFSNTTVQKYQFFGAQLSSQSNRSEERRVGKEWQILFFWAPKSLQMLNSDIKLKDACSLEEKLWPT